MSRGTGPRRTVPPSTAGWVAAAGGKVFAATKTGVLDEMPGAYKNLDDVMAAQADLVQPVQRLTPLATYKGADKAKRAKWRPDEER